MSPRIPRPPFVVPRQNPEIQQRARREALERAGREIPADTTIILRCGCGEWCLLPEHLTVVQHRPAPPPPIVKPIRDPGPPQRIRLRSPKPKRKPRKRRQRWTPGSHVTLPFERRTRATHRQTFRMTPDQRGEIARLYFDEGLSQKAVARQTGFSASTVKRIRFEEESKGRKRQAPDHPNVSHPEAKGRAPRKS